MRILAVLAALTVASPLVLAEKRAGTGPAPKAAPARKSPQRRPAQHPPAAAKVPARAASGAPQDIERLDRMSPEQRRKLMDRLPPERARKLQDQLAQYDRMPPQQREHLKRQYEWFHQLPPAKQDSIRHVFQRYSALPPDRQQAVREEFDALHNLGEPARRERLNSPDLRSRFSGDEHKLLEEMSTAVPR